MVFLKSQIYKRPQCSKQSLDAKTLGLLPLYFEEDFLGGAKFGERNLVAGERNLVAGEIGGGKFGERNLVAGEIGGGKFGERNLVAGEIGGGKFGTQKLPIRKRGCDTCGRPRCRCD